MWFQSLQFSPSRHKRWKQSPGKFLHCKCWDCKFWIMRLRWAGASTFQRVRVGNKGSFSARRPVLFIITIRLVIFLFPRNASSDKGNTFILLDIKFHLLQRKIEQKSQNLFQGAKGHRTLTILQSLIWTFIQIKVLTSILAINICQAFINARYYAKCFIRSISLKVFPLTLSQILLESPLFRWSTKS